MTVVAFTGRGLDLAGKLIQRTEWEAAAVQMGWNLGGNRMAPDILVASRDDTTKAILARKNGATIMTYEEFAGEYRMAGFGDVGGRKIIEDPWERQERERQEAAERVKAKREAFKAKQEAEAREHAVMQENPLYGLF